MEQWQKELINSNLPALLDTMQCNTTLMSMLSANSLITKDEEHELNTKTGKDRTRLMLRLLETRKDAFVFLKDSLLKTNQTGAHQILCPSVKNTFLENDNESINIKLTYNHKILLGRRQRKLYAGKFGVREVAVKVLECDEINMEEVKVLQTLDWHENIVEFLAVPVIKNQQHIIYEFCKTTLETCIKSLKGGTPYPLERLEILRQATIGLEFLHERKIIHGNIKPSNILFSKTKVDSCRVKLSDFGMARKVPDDQTGYSLKSEEFGTFDWRAPEVIEYLNKDMGSNSNVVRTPTILKYSTDVFSLGCIFYYTLTDGLHPFGPRNRLLETKIMQRNHNVNISKIKSNQSGSIHLILSMLQYFPCDRPSCTAVLSHHFFWSPKKVFDFITDTCLILDCEVIGKPDCLHFKNEFSEITFCRKEWMIRLDLEMEDFVNSITPWNDEDDCPVLGLLKTIYYIHQAENLPHTVVETQGKSRLEKCEYWLKTERFPYLITLVWISCCRIVENRIQENYYLLASEFAKINHDIAVLTPTKYIPKIKDLKLFGGYADIGQELHKSHVQKYGLTSFQVDDPSLANLSKALSNHVSIKSIKNKFSPEVWKKPGAKSESLLQVATMYGHLPAIKFFLSPLIDLDAKLTDNQGRTLLHYVGEWSYNIVAVTHFLLRKRVNLFAVDNDGNTAAHVIPSKNFVCRDLYHNWVSYIVNQGHGHVFETRNSFSKTPLHMAIEMLDVRKATIELILKNSATTIDEPNNNENTVLLLGSNNKRSWKTLKQIVELGGDPHKVNSHGTGVLHYAVDSGNLDALKYFISIGVDISGRNLDDETPIQRLQHAKMNLTEITQLLIENGADIYDLNQEHDNVAHVILQNQSNTVNQYEEWVKYIIKIGHKQLFGTKGTNGNTPIHLAVQNKKILDSTLELMLKACNVGINKKNNEGYTALQIARWFGRCGSIRQVLVRYGADWTLTDS